jgi:hypothetical protein
MKKFIIMLGLGTVLLASSAFAENGDLVNEKVKSAFKNEFVQAKEVTWQKSGNLSVAVFKMNDKIITAYFTQEGEMVGATRNLLSTELPINLQISLKKDYAGYWITDLFEFAKDGQSEYYITLHNPDQVLTLQSTDGTEWNNYRKSRK